MNIRLHVKSSLLIAFCLTIASYTFLHQVYVPQFSVSAAPWQKVAFFLLYLLPDFLAILLTQTLCRQEHEGGRRVSIVLSIISVCGAISYATAENPHHTNDLIASVGWYVSGALIGLSIIFLLVQWLANGFISRKT